MRKTLIDNPAGSNQLHRKSSRNKALFFCLAAALPLMAIALLFNVPLAFDTFLFGADLRILGYIMQAEFLAAASGILMILPLLLQVKHPFMRFVRLLLFLVCGSVLAWIAYDLDGLEGMLFYALLVFVTFGGGTLAVFDWLSGISRTFLSLLRWSMAIFLFVSFQLHFDLDIDISAWKQTDAVVAFGATFFYTLFMLEILLYPPLTWYLERKLIQDKAMSQGFPELR